MNKWTADFLLGAVSTLLIAVAVYLTQPASTLFVFIAGLSVGYGLRIGIVNMWPHIFKPRLAYKQTEASNKQ